MLDHAVAEGGRLIISSYGSRSRNDPPRDIAAYLQQLGFQVTGSALSSEDDGWVMTRIAWIDKRAQG